MDAFGLFQSEIWYILINRWKIWFIFTNYSKICHFGIENWSLKGKKSLLVFKVLLNILTFNGLSCLIFQKIQPVKSTVAVKTLLIQHNKCTPSLPPCLRHKALDWAPWLEKAQQRLSLKILPNCNLRPLPNTVSLERDFASSETGVACVSCAPPCPLPLAMISFLFSNSFFNFILFYQHGISNIFYIHLTCSSTKKYALILF